MAVLPEDGPQTPNEQYLAKIAGEEVELPPEGPQTRNEQYLAYIAENGGGGGGGTSDHRQLSNRDAANQHPISAITGLAELSDTVESILKFGLAMLPPDGIDITWDGQTEGLPTVDIGGLTGYKIGDYFTKGQFIDALVTATGGSSYINAEDVAYPIPGEDRLFSVQISGHSGAGLLFVAKAGTYPAMGTEVVIPEDGTYIFGNDEVRSIYKVGPLTAIIAQKYSDVTQEVEEILEQKSTRFTLSTIAPTEDISDGGIHIVILSEEPTTKYNGYIYLIEEA